MAKNWRRSGSHAGAAAAPVLTVTIAEDTPQVVTVSWTWTGPNPDHWRIERKHDLDAFGFVQDDAGALRTDFIDEDGFQGLLVTYRVTGKDAGGVTVTPPGAAVSNSIVISS